MPFRSPRRCRRVAAGRGGHLPHRCGRGIHYRHGPESGHGRWGGHHHPSRPSQRRPGESVGQRVVTSDHADVAWDAHAGLAECGEQPERGLVAERNNGACRGRVDLGQRLPASVEIRLRRSDDGSRWGMAVAAASIRFARTSGRRADATIMSSPADGSRRRPAHRPVSLFAG